MTRFLILLIIALFPVMANGQDDPFLTDIVPNPFSVDISANPFAEDIAADETEPVASADKFMGAILARKQECLDGL